jgi:phosphoribosylglycinamide formyltransferase-1
MQLVERYQADLNVLAGYMLILSGQMCRTHTIINLHPAAPGGPKGMWQEVIWQLIQKRAESTGMTVHLVTEGLDEGPPITHCCFPIRTGQFQRLWQEMEEKLKTRSLSQVQKEEGENNPLFRQIRQQGVIRELPLLVQTIKWFAEDRIKTTDGEVTVDGQKCPQGLDLTEEIDQIIGSEE